MNLRKSTLALALLTALLMSLGTFAFAATQSLTGVVTDDMCGKKHTMMPGKSDAECIRACVKAGAKYALLVGDKVYALNGNTTQIDRFAGKKVKVSGDVAGNAVAVKTIAETK